MKLVCVVFIILLVNFNAAVPVNLQCSYEYYTWIVVGRIYQCNIRNDLNIISSESAVITGETRSHDGSKNIDDVHGFYAFNKKIEIFPRGLEKIYKNLKLIIIANGRMREIHQSDLKPFPHLEYLSLYENDIEVLEEGLFDFNPKLASIAFWNNKISQIHPNVFDHLTKLTYLFLKRNQCINKNVDNNSAEFKELIKQVKLQCPSLSFAHKEVQTLKLNFNDLNLQFTEKLTKVENTCQNSFLNVNPKILKLEATSNDLLTNLEIIKNSLSTSSSKYTQDLLALQSKQSKDFQATNLKIQKTENQSQKLEQNMQTCRREIEAQNKTFSDKIGKLDASSAEVLKKIEEMEARLVLRQSEDAKALNSTIQASDIRYFKNMQALSRAIALQNKASNDKMDNLEKAVKTNEQNLQNLKSEIFAAFGKILEKLEENTAKIEQRTAPKIEAIMTNLKSQNQQFSTLNQKMINLEAGLATLQSELFDGKKSAQSSCGLDLDENEEQA